MCLAASFRISLLVFNKHCWDANRSISETLGVYTFHTWITARESYTKFSHGENFRSAETGSCPTFFPHLTTAAMTRSNDWLLLSNDALLNADVTKRWVIKWLAGCNMYAAQYNTSILMSTSFLSGASNPVSKTWDLETKSRPYNHYTWCWGSCCVLFFWCVDSGLWLQEYLSKM